jgi:hypothetical protein
MILEFTLVGFVIYLCHIGLGLQIVTYEIKKVKCKTKGRLLNLTDSWMTNRNFSNTYNTLCAKLFIQHDSIANSSLASCNLDHGLVNSMLATFSFMGFFAIPPIPLSLPL